MISLVIKTDKFAKRIIKNGERIKRRSLFRMAAAARNELRNVVRKRKKPSEAGKPPNDHGTYRNTALFRVSGTSGFEAGFADFKAKEYGRKSKRLTLGDNLAQDTLEFGGTIRQRVIYRDRSKNPKINTFLIKARPHVSVAEDNLFNASTKNAQRFRRAQQDLIDNGYLK